MGDLLDEDSRLRFDYGNMRNDVGLIGKGADFLSVDSLDENNRRY